MANCRIDAPKINFYNDNHPEERAWLNRWIHSRVFEAYNAQVRHIIERDPDAVGVMDAALLIDTGYHKHMGKLIVVYASQQDQVSRLMPRDRFTLEQAMARISSQMPLDEKRAYADFVVENTGTREETERQAREIFAKLKAEAGQRE